MCVIAEELTFVAAVGTHTKTHAYTLKKKIKKS